MSTICQKSEPPSQKLGHRAGTLEAEIVVRASAWNTTENVERVIRNAVTTVANHSDLVGESATSVSIVLSDDAEIHYLNASHRNQNKPTNVLSFPHKANAGELNDCARYRGDVILAFETISKEAEEAGLRFEDHLSHLVIHGLLHLFGFDHKSEDEAETMERLEIRLLEKLNIANPYQDAI